MTATDLEPVTGEIEPAAPLLPMLSPAEAAGAMRAYQELCAAILEPNDWIGRAGEPDSFIRKSGWDKQATFYGVSVELLGETKLERDADGKLIRASARARATARDGRFREAGGACSRDERRFATAAGRQKIEHDLPSSAETRAENRAVSKLIGFGATSAEEMTDADLPGPNLPPWAADVPDGAIDRLGGYLEAILQAAGVDEPERVALELGNGVTTYCGGVFPRAAAELARLLARAIPQPAQVVDGEAVEPAPESEGTTK